MPFRSRPPLPFQFPVESPVAALSCFLVVREWHGTRLFLPGEVLWALALNEGDLVSADVPYPESPEIRFRSYLHRVRGAREACDAPWEFVAEFLRQPLAAVGPDGALDLTGFDTCDRFKPGEPLLLCAESRPIEPAFRLQRPEAAPQPEELWARARYRLQVEPGFQVTLPEDALWALSLSEGSVVKGRSSMWTFQGVEPSWKGEGVCLEIGAGGILPLPERLRSYPQYLPGKSAILEVFITAQSSSFTLNPSFEDLLA